MVIRQRHFGSIFQRYNMSLCNLRTMKKVIRRQDKFSIYDLNFILIFVGSAVASTLYSGVNMAAASAVFSLISLICLIKSGFKTKTISKEGNYYLVLLILIVLRTTIDLYFGSLSGVSSYMKLFVIIFGYGIVLIPLLSVISSYERINWRLTLPLTFLLLFIVVGYGVVNSSLDSSITSNGRIVLNEKLGSIPFAENSSYLLMLSLIQLVFPPFKSKFFKNVFKILCILGLVLSFYGFSKAASRGPFLAAFVVVLFFLYNNSKHFKSWVFLLIFFSIFGSVTIISSFEKFAPLLYARINNTIEEGDDERALLFSEGVEMFKNSPIIGDNPMIVWEGGFTGRHNVFLDIALFLGIIGLIVYIVLVLKILSKLKNFKRSEPVPLLFYMIFISCMIRSVASFTLLKDAMFSIMFVMTCIYVELEYKRNKLIR